MFATFAFTIVFVAMTPDYPTASMLLSLPSSTPPQLVSDADRFGLGQSLRDVAVQRGLLDPGQAVVYFRPQDDFEADLRVVRLAAEDLADCPPLSDVWRLPLADWREAARFNRRFASSLRGQARLFPERSALFAEIEAETDALYRVYDQAGDAASEGVPTRSRRTALRGLRRDLGEADYEAMLFPPNVPVWRFNVMER